MVLETSNRKEIDMSSAKSKVNFAAVILKMVSGLTKHYAGQSLPLGGATVKVDDLVADFNKYAPQATTTEAAHTAWTQEVVALDALDQALNASLVLLRSYLRGALGVTNPVLSDFGITPRKSAAKSLAVKAVAAEKSRATRVARHTMGPRQKASIHGVVPAPETPATPDGKPPKAT
jgi:hypothetical protein